MIFGSLSLCVIYHFWGTSVHEDWAHGSLFIWLHCVWKFDSIGAVNYTFSYLIPIVSIWFIWREREILKNTQWHNYTPGLVLLAVLLFIHGIALRAQLPHLSAITLIGAIWSLALSLGGKRIGKTLLFSAFYLTLAVPLSFIERATFPLRNIAAKLAAATLNGLALPVNCVGTAICDANGAFKLDVADPCSGIRSLLALMALSLAFSKLSRLNKTGKVLLFASFLPVAIIANVSRIVMLAFAAKIFGIKLAMGVYHDISGYIVFGVAALLLPIVEYLLTKCFSAADKTDGTQPSTTHCPNPVGKKISISLVVIITLAIPYSIKMEKISTLTTEPINMKLPSNIGSWHGERIYYSSDESVSRIIRQSEIIEEGVCPQTGTPLMNASFQERIGLPSDTKIIKSIYSNYAGKEILVTIVLSGETRGSIHKPQWCISAQGFKVISTSFPQYRNSGDKKVALLQLEMPHTKQHSFFCYWFIGHNYSTPYHTSRVLRMAFDRLIKGHSTRWAYVSISGQASQSIEKLIPDFVRNMEETLTIDQNLP